MDCLKYLLLSMFGDKIGDQETSGIEYKIMKNELSNENFLFNYFKLLTIS